VPAPLLNGAVAAVARVRHGSAAVRPSDLPARLDNGSRIYDHEYQQCSCVADGKNTPCSSTSTDRTRIGATALWDPRDASPPTLVEITRTKWIWSPPTFATGCRFSLGTVGLCGGKPLVAVTRERRYGPSRLRVNDDDDGCGNLLTVLPRTSLLNLTEKERRVRKGMGETGVQQQRETGKGRSGKGMGSASTAREVPSNFAAAVATMTGQNERATGVSDRQPPTFPTPLLHTRHSSRVIITRPVLPFQGLQSATPTAKRTAFCLIGSFLRKSTKFRDLPVFLNILRCIFCFFECIFNFFIYMPPTAIRTVRAKFRRGAEPCKIKKPHCSFGSDHAVAYAN